MHQALIALPAPSGQYKSPGHQRHSASLLQQLPLPKQKKMYLSIAEAEMAAEVI
jgi:hypothetical protein